MNCYKWTTDELMVLEEWDWAVTYYENLNPNYRTDREVVRLVELEAKLLIANKTIIVYPNDLKGRLDIVSFNEFLKIRESVPIRKKLKYHPINHSNHNEYTAFLSNTREKIFSD